MYVTENSGCQLPLHEFCGSRCSILHMSTEEVHLLLVTLEDCIPESAGKEKGMNI